MPSAGPRSIVKAGGSSKKGSGGKSSSKTSDKKKKKKKKGEGSGADKAKRAAKEFLK